MMFRYIWAWLQALFGYVKGWFPKAHDSAWLGAAPAMEEEPVTVSLGPIGPLFQQLRSVIAALQGNSDRLKLKGVKAQIQILGQELEWLCIDLMGRSEAPADAISRWWTRQVRDLCYDTADYLDELMHFIHCSSGTRRRRIRVRTFWRNRLVGSKTFRISGKLSWLSLPKVKKLKRAPLIAKLSALVARIEDADETRKRFKLSPPTYSKPDYGQAAVVMPQITKPQLDIDKLNKLLDLDGNEMEKNLKVVTIFGSAGVDKTAVVRTLYHQHGGRFQHRAFIRVTRDPDMRRLLTDMLSQIKAPPTYEFSNVREIIVHITKHLQGKRYLIIIDDLWTTSTWDIIIRALPDGDYCRIITTTQVEDVALACCSYQLKHIYEITPLNDDQSGKSEGGCTTYPSSERMKNALNLAYNNLPPRLKTCLLYLNMYPEGYTVWKDELVKQWLAEGFIGSVQGQDIEDTAGYYFDALVSSGLVQSVDTNHNGEVLSCTLHHMVLDLIRQKSMEENFVTIVNYFQTILGLPDKVRRLSVQLGGAKGANHIPENMRISQVRSLLFSGYFKHVPSILDYGLLQVLILHIWSDEHVIFDLITIGELYRLRYLKIESNMTVKLPGKILRLRHLGTLQVDARLSAVPSDIVHLEKLLHLRLRSESNLPHGVGRMTSLRTLGYFDIGSNSEDNVRGLGELENLQDLQLTCSTVQPAESLGRNVQLLGSVLHKLSILQSVTLAPASGSCKGNTPSDYAAVSSMSISCDGFSSVSPPPSLQRLELSRHCCIFSRVPKWFGELAQLCILKIAVRELSKEDIDILKALPALTALSLHVVTTSAEMIVFGKGGFLVLTYFKFTCTVAWLKLEADAMPNLQKLRLGFNATIVDEQGIIIEHLPGINEISAIIGSSGVGAASAWRKAITNDPRNPKVHWMSLIHYSDQGAGHVVTHEYCRNQDKGSGESEIMDETDGAEDENNNDAAHSGRLRKGQSRPLMGQKVLVWFLMPMTVLNRLLTPIMPTVLVITVLGWLLTLIISSVPLKQHSRVTSWDVAVAGWAITVLCWLLSPIFCSVLPKILSYLGFDVSSKLRQLEIHIIPGLENTLQAVDQVRMFQRGALSDVFMLDKMAARLRHAREDAEDIFDDAQHKICGGDILYGVLQTCVACFNRSCMGKIFRRSEDVLPVTTSTSASDGPIIVTTNAEVSYEPAVPMTAPSDPSGQWLSCWCSTFDFFRNCCRSTFYWIIHAIEVTHTYRNWSYEVLGITSYQENATALDFVLAAISRRKLKKRIEKVEDTISEVKKSPLLCVASNSILDDIANKNRVRIRTASMRKIFGREVLRDDIMARLRDTPQGDALSSITSPCYSVIGIYGVAGSGKTTFARYIRNYIEEECKEKLFDTIMSIHVSETFIVDDIFHEMLKDITGNLHSNISDREDLENKLKEELRGKRFFLILDDLWVKSKNDPQLEELIGPLNVGLKGSKILVTARRKDAARALCDDEPIEMPDLDEDLYISMFMHYALGGTGVGDEEEFIQVGRVIAKKLHRSPIAAVAVAGRLGTNLDIKYWKNTANHGMLNATMDTLWWSYRHLNPNIRRCLEYCNIFPRRSKLEKDDLVRLWVAQGFVKTSCGGEDLEDVAHCYIQELVSCSFLQPEETWFAPTADYFTIHDLLHDLLDKVSGSDYFRIENERSRRGEGWRGDIPRDVRHLFVQNYVEELIAEKILGLENLRSIIIYVVDWDTTVEEKVIESICRRLPKLRVLAVAFSHKHCGGIWEPNKLSVPQSISQLKHLRYLAFRTQSCTVILPGALTKLHHIQLLDFGDGKILEFTFAGLINLRHIICWRGGKFPNIGRLISLQTMAGFTVSNEQGYEVKQLRDLNKLRGDLEIYGLENVKSKEEALEANLAAKEWLTKLKLGWGGNDDTRCSPEVEAGVLEGLCPPEGLETLEIKGYKGSRYPDWIVGKQNGGPEGLQNLLLMECSQLGVGPELQAFPHLRLLWLSDCSWDALPGNMELLTSLKILYIFSCVNIRLLPTLPQSLEEFNVSFCNDEFVETCQTVGHPNWQKIQHIPKKTL